MKKLMCKIFGCKTTSTNMADFTCPRCGTHHKVKWPDAPTSVVYVITTMDFEDDIQSTKRKRPVGWYAGLADAEKIVEGNYGDIYEVGYYPWVVIEAIPEGLYPDIPYEYWYKWEGDVETGSYVKATKPETYSHTVNFGMG